MQRSTRRRIHTAIPAVLALLLQGCTSRPGEPASASAAVSAAALPVTVRRILPARGAIARTVRLPTYRVRPLQEATLHAKVAGYLKTMAVDKGDRVESGQLLAEIEVPELLADEAQYVAEVDVARTTYERMARARERAPDLVVPQTLDDLRGRWEIASAKLEHTRTMLRYARLTAPFRGVITARFVDPGAFIPAATSSSAEGSAVLTVMDVSRLRVQVFVPEAEVRFVRDGLPVEIVVDELPDQPLAGTVTRSAYALDEATKTMLVEIEVPNDGSVLRPGMYATVRFRMETHDDALLLPAAAVVSEKSGSFVYRIVEGKLAKTPVELGFKDGAMVEIAQGIEPDQPVALAQGRPLVDRQPVEIAEGR